MIRVSFAAGILQNRKELSRHLRRILAENATRLGLTLRDPEDEAGSFAELISDAAHKYGQKRWC